MNWLANINSTNELQKILFQDLGLPTVKKTKTGFSTDVSVLETLQEQHPIVKQLLQYRTATKLQNTYIEALPRLINPHTGRIHSSFNQAVTATGRLSSSDPNMQNIPVRDKTGRQIRHGFIPMRGHLLLAADYSQIELRVLAHLSDDPTLIHAFANNLDIHNLTASQLFSGGNNLETITPEQRRIGKTVNFSVIYGQTPFGLAKQLGISQSEAKTYIENFFRQYPKVLDYKQSIIEQGEKDGFVTTLLGRRRFIQGLNDKNRMRREGAQRMAFNTPVQGSASDLIKKAMIDLDNQLSQKKMQSRLILQVHDELLLEAPEKEIDSLQKEVRNIMENVYPMQIPLLISMKPGSNWEQAH